MRVAASRHIAARARCRRRGVLATFATVFLTVTVPASAIYPASVAHAQGFEYRLGSGDRLRVTVFGHDDLSGEFEVGPSGTIAFPLVGEIQVSDRTLRQTEQAIVTSLKPDYLKNPQVGVEVLNYRPFYIIGEVNQPGSYPYVNGMRVVNAVALAGGFTYRAKEGSMTIARDGIQGEPAEAGPNTVVQPGDVITVPERFF